VWQIQHASDCFHESGRRQPFFDRREAAQKNHGLLSRKGKAFMITPALGFNIYRCRSKFGITVREQVSFLCGNAFYADNRLGIGGAAKPLR